MLPGRLVVGAVCWGLCEIQNGGGSHGDRVCPGGVPCGGPLWGCAGAVGQEVPLALRECEPNPVTWAMSCSDSGTSACLGETLGSNVCSQGHKRPQDIVPLVVQYTVPCHAGPQGRGDGH